ncbi:MAG TPA: hypothetical protein VFR70_09625, partial [Flavobacterium sp.]|nr:hypothetical protein [Flavobacterium sp.]
MDEQNKVWEDNILNSLKELSDIDVQYLSWLGLDDSHISSFTEVLGMLYDTFGFDDYIEYYKLKYRNEKVYNNLVQLDKMINDYQTTGYELEKKGDVG